MFEPILYLAALALVVFAGLRFVVPFALDRLAGRATCRTCGVPVTGTAEPLVVYHGEMYCWDCFEGWQT